MLDNLKLVLHQHKKFLTIFFLIVFVPSIILAFFGIRAINNERYKLQQINHEQQWGFVRALKIEVQSLIEKEIFNLREFSTSRALIDGNHQAFSEMVLERLQEGIILGQVVIWNGENPPWFPGLAVQPPAAKTPAAPAEWSRFRSDLERAERTELRLKNFTEAVSLYGGILQRSNENQVRAWIQSRIARCEVKKKNYEQALKIHRLLIENFPDLLTELGRPLEIVSRLEILDILLAYNKVADFFQESLQTFERLEQRFWSLDGSLVQMYVSMLHEKVDNTLRNDSLGRPPANYQSSVEDIRNSIENKLDIWDRAEAVRKKLLPDIRDKINNSRDNPGLQKNVLEIESQDVLTLLLPLNSQMPENNFEFLGSLLGFDDMGETIGTFIMANAPQGISTVIRSNLSNDVLYGEINSADQTPAVTDFFSGIFPPWKVEIYQKEGAGLGIPLYKNIFFWIILALIIIVFFGSGLIIRTIVQEVNLLNLKSEFIASVSHEFKTPLTAMGAILERLLSDEVKDSKKKQEYYQILSHDSEKLKRLVKNVLDFTKIEDGKREYRLADTDISQLVRKEVDSFLKENKMAGFRVEMSIEGDIPLVSADEEALSQAFHNILDNAAKFSGREKKIEVKVVCKESRVEIAVQDWGIGISENEQKKVFEKFYRSKQASSVSPTGTGLGLTLVKHILDGHAGCVVIQSQLGKGSCVSLVLPSTQGG